jgi:DNA-binding NtrC family response regulator
VSARSILVVEDDRSAATYLQLVLEEAGFAVQTAEDGVQALLALENASFDLVCSDLRMAQMGGLELLAHLQQRWRDLPVIVITADSEVSEVVEAMQLGAVNYLVKPAAPHVVLAAVRKALATRPPAARVASGIPEIVGQSKAVVEVRHLVVLAARSDVHVLITGATGTGKELVARAIHRTSNLASGPFVEHNCAVSPRDLFESEFFGHRRGAFTGAERDHVGLLTRAHGGVLFLDELETLDPSHQAKLLRVLDDGKVRPVGAEATHEVSVRFVAATNRDPREMIKAGALREDLYYRLRGFEIRLPPLRQRAEDIPLLVRHMLGSSHPGFTPEAMDALMHAPWPGNVRELLNAVRSARALAGDGRIGVRHLGLDTAHGRAEARERAPLPRGATLREIERDAIIQTIRECDGNRTQAAHVLGIDRSTLRRKIKEFGIETGE